MNTSLRSTLALLTGVATLVLLGSLLLPAPAVAQNALPGFAEPSDSYVKDYGRPGYPRVRVYLWGNADSGVWTVEEGTDFLDFLSTAGNGNFNRQPDRRVKNFVRLYREGQTNAEPVFEERLESLFARQVAYPTLQNGDVLVIETEQRRRRFTLRQVGFVTGTLASIASLVFIVQ